MTPPRTAIHPAEAVCVVAICFGWPILGSLQAMQAGFRGASFSDEGFLILIGCELLFAAGALALLRWRRYDLASLNPRPSLVGALLGGALYLVVTGVNTLALGPFAASAAWEPVTTLLEESTLSLPILVATALVNGTYEEVFLLGFLSRGLQRYGASIALGVPLLVRLLYHLYQGPLGALSVLLFGLVLGLFYLRTGGLFPVVFCHVLADIVPFL